MKKFLIMKNIVIKEFSDIYETIFHVSTKDQMYAIDKKDNLIKPYVETEQYKELLNGK